MACVRRPCFFFKYNTQHAKSTRQTFSDFLRVIFIILSFTNIIVRSTVNLYYPVTTPCTVHANTRSEITRNGDENKTFYYFTIIIVVTPRQARFAYVLFVYFFFFTFLRRTHATYVFCVYTRRGPITREHHHQSHPLLFRTINIIVVPIRHEYINVTTVLLLYMNIIYTYIITCIKNKQRNFYSQTRITPLPIARS